MIKVLTKKTSRIISCITIFCIVLLSINYGVTKSNNPVEAKNGMVVSAKVYASNAGIEILKKGGNAVDAAVAVAYALAVTDPKAGNIGGGGFMVIRMPDGTSTTFDYREKAPSSAHRDMYLDSIGEIIEYKSTLGPHAAGVPGTVAGTILALEKYGTLPLKDVMGPAIKLAENGFPLTQGMAKRFNSNRSVFLQFEETAENFTKKNENDLFKTNELFVQKDLARTLNEIAKKGRDGFYKGWVADKIVETMKKYDGIISHDDLANYNSVEREPIKGSYKGHEIITMGPPSAGGIALIQLLNMIENYDIGNLGWNSSKSIHLMTEAERRVYADRIEYLGDPDFVMVPMEELTSKEYSSKRASTIDPFFATSSSDVTHGDINMTIKESEQTTHYSVIDKDGMAVSVTTTLNSWYGNKMVVGGAGFFLNNEMDDFSSKVGKPNKFGLIGGEVNAIKPGKRMVSSMTPTIISKDGKPYIITGTPGGSTIITTVFQIIMNVVDHGMDIQQAVNAPRVHHQWYPETIQHEKYALSKDTMTLLKNMGHKFSLRGAIGRAHSIMIDLKNGMYYGAADPRLEGVAVGY